MAIEDAPPRIQPAAGERAAGFAWPHLADPLWIVVLLSAALLASTLTYWPRLGDYFLLDDWVWLRAVHGRDVFEVLRRGFTFPVFTPYDAPTPYFRPATDVGFKLETLAFGLRPTPYHLTNIALHAGVAAMAGTLLARLVRSWPAGLALAVIFATYPSYDVAVTWISELAELQGAFFAVLALLCWHIWLTSSRPATVLATANLTAAVALVLATMSKESQGMTFALFPALAFVATPLRRSRRDIITWLLVVGSLLAVYLAYAYVRERGDRYSGGAYAFDWDAVTDARDYAERAILPYAMWSARADLVRHAGLAVYLALGVFAAATRRRTAALLFLWSVLWLVPFAFLTTLTQYRYTYLPSLPAIAFVIALAADAWRALPAGAAKVLAAAAVPAGIALLVVQAAYVRDQQAVFVDQSRQYEAAARALREQCAGLEPGGVIFIQDRAGVLDPYNTDIPAMANVLYERVAVVGTRPADSNDPRRVCVAAVRSPG